MSSEKKRYKDLSKEEKIIYHKEKAIASQRKIREKRIRDFCENNDKEAIIIKILSGHI